ncbi:MAG: RNA polymerase sigma factor [Pseudomonadales bacterium]|nr:RNA polymerase sigma factor [Pseudomonadales bacterium]
MDNKALDQFLSDVQMRAYQMARMAVGCEQDALDIVQDAMMALVKHYADKEASQWHGLFFKTLQNRIYDQYRRNAVKHKWFGWLGLSKSDDAQDNELNADPIQQAVDQKLPSPEMQLQQGQATQKLIDAVEKLPIRQQQAFMLRLWEGMSVAETAAAMSLSEGSVKTHYSRAVTSLKQQLEAYW